MSNELSTDTRIGTRLAEGKGKKSIMYNKLQIRAEKSQYSEIRASREEKKVDRVRGAGEYVVKKEVSIVDPLGKTSSGKGKGLLTALTEKDLVRLTKITLHVGIDKLNPGHYGDENALEKCVSDARALWEKVQINEELLSKDSVFVTNQIRPEILINERATRIAVKQKIIEASMKLEPGNLFILSYAGHGAQIPDINSREEDGLNETWCLYDGMLLDDELNELWTLFKPGVRIWVISDSCHSGTIVDSPQDLSSRAMINSIIPDVSASIQGKPRFLSRKAAFAIYKTHQDFYDSIMNDLARKEVLGRNIPASVRVWAACRDNQLAQETNEGGLFTTTILKALQTADLQNRRDVTFNELFQRVVEGSPITQTPVRIKLGRIDEDFDNLVPFSATLGVKKPQRENTNNEQLKRDLMNLRTSSVGRYTFQAGSPLSGISKADFLKSRSQMILRQGRTYFFAGTTKYSLNAVDTILFWLKIDQSPPPAAAVLFQIDGLFSIQIVDGEKLVITIDGNAYEAPYLFDEGHFHHVAIFPNAGTGRVALQGDTEKMTDLNFSFQDQRKLSAITLTNVQFGHDNNPEGSSHSFRGKMCGFSMWSAELKEMEIKAWAALTPYGLDYANEAIRFGDSQLNAKNLIAGIAKDRNLPPSLVVLRD